MGLPGEQRCHCSGVHPFPHLRCEGSSTGLTGGSPPQVGIRQALEDELGGVNDMVVGERRQFVVTEDTVLENIGGGKLFGVKLPPGKSVLVDVRLLKIRPY